MQQNDSLADGAGGGMSVQEMRKVMSGFNGQMDGGGNGGGNGGRRGDRAEAAVDHREEPPERCGAALQELGAQRR